MKLAIKLAFVFLALVGLMLVAPGCSNGGKSGCSNDADCGGGLHCQSGQCVQCTNDGHCNAQNKCMVCNGSQCVKKSDCCVVDLDCPSGQRCFNVSGKAYGQCGAR